MVSDADRDAEALVVELLAAERPEDGVFGEERADSEGPSGRRWVVDPLDGTTNYLYGFPAWAVSVAVQDEAGPLAGVVYDPLRDELFAAARGAGCTLDGRPVAEPAEVSLDQALIATGFAYEAERRAEQAQVLSRVLPRARDIRRAGAAALDLAWVAAGRVDGYFERGLKPWDWAAGRLLVAEAGGTVAELAGEPPGLVAARSPGLAQSLAEIVGHRGH